MVLITRRASSPNKKMWYFLNNKPILIRSMLAGGIVQDTFAGEAGEGERRRLEATSTAIFTAQAIKSSVSYILNFIRKTLTCACVLEADVLIYIYISRCHRHD